MNYYQKYLKYKNKYQNLLQHGGMLAQMQNFRLDLSQEQQNINVLSQKSETIQSIKNPIELFINPENNEWYLYQLGLNKIVYGSFEDGKINIRNGCKYVSMKVLNNTRKQREKAGFIYVGNIVLDKFSNRINVYKLLPIIMDGNFEYTHNKFIHEIFKLLFEQIVKKREMKIFSDLYLHYKKFETLELLGGYSPLMSIINSDPYQSSEPIDDEDNIFLIFKNFYNEIEKVQPVLLGKLHDILEEIIFIVYNNHTSPEKLNYRDYSPKIRRKKELKHLIQLTDIIFKQIEKQSFTIRRLLIKCPEIEECDQGIDSENPLCEIYFPEPGLL